MTVDKNVLQAAGDYNLDGVTRRKQKGVKYPGQIFTRIIQTQSESMK